MDDQGATMWIPGSNGESSTVPKACLTPTSPGSITTTSAPSMKSTPIRLKKLATARSNPGLLPPVVPERASIRKKATSSRIPPKTSLPIGAPGCWKDGGETTRSARRDKRGPLPHPAAPELHESAATLRFIKSSGTAADRCGV